MGCKQVVNANGDQTKTVAVRANPWSKGGGAGGFEPFGDTRAAAGGVSMAELADGLNAAVFRPRSKQWKTQFSKVSIA